MNKKEFEYYEKQRALCISLNYGLDHKVDDEPNLPDREYAIAAAKALIDHYNIKQEELYPWIACSEQMPDEGQEVLVGYLVDGKIIAYEQLVSFTDVDYGDFILQEWRTHDGELMPDDFDGDPTHWHPIPTL